MDTVDHDEVVRLRADLEALDRLIQTHRTADQAAGALLSIELREKLEKVNEFRGALADAQATMIPRSEVAAIQAGVERVQDDIHRDLARVAEVIPTLLNREDYESRHKLLQDTINRNSGRLDRIEASAAGQAQGLAESAASATRSRTIVFAVLGIVIALGGLLLGLDQRKASTTNNVPAATTTVSHP